MDTNTKNKSGHTEKISTMVILTPQIVRQLDKIAEQRTTSRSVIVREACQALIRHQGKLEAA